MSKPTYNIHAWIERITPPGPGEEEATHKEMFDFSSQDHDTMHAAYQAGIAALIAGKQSRDEETKDAVDGKLRALQIIGLMLGGEPCCEEHAAPAPEPDHNPFHAFPNTIPCGTPQQHASGLDQIPTFTPEEVAGIAPESPGIPPIAPEVLGLVVANAEDVNRAGDDAPEPLPKREPIEEGDQRGHRYSCSQECADSGHTLNGAHTIHRATSEAQAAQILADAQPGESRVVVGEFATKGDATPIRFDV